MHSFSYKYYKALFPSPPPQPPLYVSQSIEYCSESASRTPVEIAYDDSVFAAVANDQQEPHAPWSLTGLTTKRLCQSIALASFGKGAIIRSAEYGVLMQARGRLLARLDFSSSRHNPEG